MTANGQPEDAKKNSGRSHAEGAAADWTNPEPDYYC